MIVYTGAEPIKLRFETETNLTGGSVEIHVLKPDRTVVAWSATVTDARAGVCEYETQPDDLDMPGIWHLQVVHIPAGATDGVPGEVATLTVEQRLNP